MRLGFKKRYYSKLLLFIVPAAVLKWILESTYTDTMNKQMVHLTTTKNPFYQRTSKFQKVAFLQKNITSNHNGIKKILINRMLQLKNHITTKKENNIRINHHQALVLSHHRPLAPPKLNYVPKHRVVHFDLKGAPPLPLMYKTLIPLIAKNGATDILMEYEDMFPWSGSLRAMAADNHYTKEDIVDIIRVCKQNNVSIIPLIQTFGHLEFALKLKDFSHLQEVESVPQSICPTRNGTETFIREMIDQIMRLHSDIKYIHIGCDEVYQIGRCSTCKKSNKEELFLSHVASTALYIKEKYNIASLLWHDMIITFSEHRIREHKLSELVEPVVWVYPEDVYHFAGHSLWTKIAKWFPNAWTASAYKGAFGEHLDITNIYRHLNNNLKWLEVMSEQSLKLGGEMRGIVITGWQRYEHFGSLCELLPSAIPSLVINIITVTHGYFNISLHNKVLEALNCPKTFQNKLDFHKDHSQIDTFSHCAFPGVQFFSLLPLIQKVKEKIESYVTKYTLSRSGLSDYNMQRSYASKMRVNEDIVHIHAHIKFTENTMKSVGNSLKDWFDEYTIGEWLEQHYWSNLKRLTTIRDQANTVTQMKHWIKRPLPILPEIAKYLGLHKKSR